MGRFLGSLGLEAAEVARYRREAMVPGNVVSLPQASAPQRGPHDEDSPVYGVSATMTSIATTAPRATFLR